MRLVETVPTRWVLGLTAAVFAASLVVVIAQRPCTHGRSAAVSTHRHVKPSRACRERTRPAPREVTGADYREVLLAQRPAFEACTAKAKHDVTYTLTANVRPNGTVESVDVKAETSDMRQVDLKAVKCLEQAMSSAAFPATAAMTRVSTTLRRS